MSKVHRREWLVSMIRDSKYVIYAQNGATTPNQAMQPIN